MHSWVLPFAEVWNEPIATYVGDLVMCDMGYPEEGLRRINVTKYDIHNTVAVMSLALGEDLFDFFNSKGIKADRTKAEIKL